MLQEGTRTLVIQGRIWTGIVFTKIGTATVTANTKPPNTWQTRSSEQQRGSGRAASSFGNVSHHSRGGRNKGAAVVKRSLSASEVQSRPYQASNTGLGCKPFLTAAHSGSAQHKISASFSKLLSFSGTIFGGLWFSAKWNLKNKTLVHYIMAPVLSRNILPLIKSPQITFWKPCGQVTRLETQEWCK